jgi:hypothetical protein
VVFLVPLWSKNSRQLSDSSRQGGTWSFLFQIRPHVFYLLVYGTADLEFWDIRKKLKLRYLKKNTPRIRFYHLKMQHDYSKCLKFSSAVEIEYKRFDLQRHYCNFEKSYKTEPFRITSLFAFFSILFFIFFRPPDHHFLVACPIYQQIINMWPNASGI